MRTSVLLVSLILVSLTIACTNFLVTPGASTDGSSIISYAADSSVLYGELYHYPAADHAEGSMREVYDWDTGVYMGKIPEAAHTHNVIGNMNEFQLAIAETTYGGLEQLQQQPGAIMDYGSLIYVALQRTKTAREAIALIANLMDEYGYASEGESFSLADPNEVWIMDLIGKGPNEKGAVWVAKKIPDGFVSGHANQARITTFMMNDTQNVMFSKDVITFARRKGLYPSYKPDSQFSFSDVYDPVTFSGARFCEARTWSMFRKVCGSDWGAQYENYAKGYDLSNRMPLWVKPQSKLSVHDVMNLMRDHYEGTYLDMTPDIGAEPFQVPYRWRPMTWSYHGQNYLHERATSTQQTGWSMVAQLRGFMPREVGPILWFGVDDTASTVYVPMYAAMTRIPDTWGPGDIMKFSYDSAFWIFNLVTNWAYTKYNLMYPEIREKIEQLEQTYINEVYQVVDKQALTYLQTDRERAIEYLTQYSVSTADELTKTWNEFFKFLFVKYMDGNVRAKNPDPTKRNPIINNPGYSKTWLGRIVDEAGDHFRVPNAANSAYDRKLRILNKH